MRSIINPYKALILNLVISGSAYGQDREKEIHWEGMFKPGVVYNIPSPLSVRQEGHPEINLKAKYYSEPLIFPIYGCVQIRRWADDKLWEIETLHQKLFLKNKPPEITQFSISHGFNIVTINRGWKLQNKFIVRTGLGIVLAHPETTIRGKKWDESNGLFGLGYYITGPSTFVSVARKWEFWKYFIASVETGFTASFAKVPIVDGHANVTNFAFNALAGLGFRL